MMLLNFIFQLNLSSNPLEHLPSLQTCVSSLLNSLSSSLHLTGAVMSSWIFCCRNGRLTLWRGTTTAQAKLVPTGVERPALHYITSLSLSSVSQTCGGVGGEY